MINDALDLAKIESGKFVLDKKPLISKRQLQAFMKLSKSISKGKNIKVNFHIENNIGILNADEIRFRQILYNLVSNAIKFTDKGGIISIDARCLEKSLK